MRPFELSQWRMQALSLVVCAAIALSASLARAQSSAPIAQPATPPGAAEARALFEQGLAYGDHDQWGQALEAFRRARAIVERPNIVLNIAIALMRLGRPTEAIRAVEDFMRISD